MVTKLRGQHLAENMLLGSKNILPGALATGGGGLGVLPKVTDAMPPTLRCERVLLTIENIDALAANDYGSQEIALLPNRDLIILSCKFRSAGTAESGVALNFFTSNVGSALFIGIGTAAASATPLTGTMQNVLNETQGVDVSAGLGKVNGFTQSNLKIAAGASNKLYLNIRDAVTSAAGVATFVGCTIDICYLDLGPA